MGAHGETQLVADLFGVDVFVLSHRVAVVDPQEGADLHFLGGLDELAQAVVRDHDGFAGAHVADGLESDVDVGMAFGSHGIVGSAAADDEGGATQIVAGGDDAVGGENQHGDATFDVTVDVTNAVGEVFALGDEECDEFGGVGATHAEFGELLALVQAELFQFVDIVDFAYGTNGEAS